MKKRLIQIFIPGIIILLSGCAPAFQHFQTKINAESLDMTNKEKSDALESFIQQNTNSKLNNYIINDSCIEYSYSISDSSYKYKYCYILEDTIINKKDESICETYNPRTREWWKHRECANIGEQPNKFHDYIKLLEDKMSKNFNNHIAFVGRNINEIRKNIKLGNKELENNKKENALAYFRNACILGSGFSCNKEKEIFDNIEKEKKEIEYKKIIQKEKEEKILAESNKLKMIESLKNRKGQYTIILLDGFRSRAYSYETLFGRRELVTEEISANICKEQCTNQIYNTSGYISLQEALDDGWKFQSKIYTNSYSMSEHCICDATTYLLEK
ncbi:MAG: hypothetical protein WCS26_09595 [Arcobacteraceae bacterium]|jgi:hypothetical protein